MEEEINNTEARGLAEASSELQSSKTNNTETENHTEALTKSQSEKNSNEPGNHAETSTKGQSSRQSTPKSLKAKSKAIKKSPSRNPLKSMKAKVHPKFQGKNKKKNKELVLGNKERSKNEHADVGKLNSSEKNVSNQEHIKKDQENQNNQEKVVGSSKGQKNRKGELVLGNKERSKNEHAEAGKLNSSEKNISNKEHIKEDQENQNNQEKVVGSSKGQKNRKCEEKRGGSDKSLRNQKSKGKLDGKQKNEWDEKKTEKIGGMIFMCSAKTKPDCFRYRVMGVTMNKKDTIMAVKPGLKLFLYDFDLKLMYGIYRATSSGGVKLEPKAFGGAFPVQVRFVVHKDCFPIAEGVFKKAIKDNYNEKNKFKTELTVRQVRKLSDLFRSVTTTVRPPPKMIVQDREVYTGSRELRGHSDREAFSGAMFGGRSYPVPSDERDRRTDYRSREVGTTHRDEIPRDLFMSEKEYRAYGLSGERRKLTPSHHFSSTLDPYPRDQEREHLLRQPDPIYREIAPLQREAVLVDPLYLNQVYNPGGRGDLIPATTSIAATASVSAISALDTYTRDPYYTYHYGTPSADAYLLPRRDEVSAGPYYVEGRRELIDTDLVRRRDIEVDKLYSPYAPDSLSNYNQVLQYRGANPELGPPPVSSRYSFAGPSVSYR